MQLGCVACASSATAAGSSSPLLPCPRRAPFRLAEQWPTPSLSTRLRAVLQTGTAGLGTSATAAGIWPHTPAGLGSSRAGLASSPQGFTSAPASGANTPKRTSFGSDAGLPPTGVGRPLLRCVVCCAAGALHCALRCAGAFCSPANPCPSLARPAGANLRRSAWDFAAAGGAGLGLGVTGRSSFDISSLGSDGLAARRPFHMGLAAPGGPLGGYAGKHQRLCP